MGSVGLEVSIFQIALTSQVSTEVVLKQQWERHRIIFQFVQQTLI